ncbi:hypothetical protein EJ110_NYTH02034 [Nymphaea thermarum]|nr:hypothetical protein EJ110_NYTH02034 [Nymphaea thermarum]
MSFLNRDPFPLLTGCTAVGDPIVRSSFELVPYEANPVVHSRFEARVGEWVTRNTAVSYAKEMASTIITIWLALLQVCFYRWTTQICHCYLIG